MEKAHQPTIGILDSGVGGLSVLNEIHSLLPTNPIHYIADSAWCPYGSKSQEEIQQRVFTIVDRLLELGCDIIVVACNSATIAAVEALRAKYPIPFVGMEPGLKPATQTTKTGVVGILATEASLAGEKFHRLLSNHKADIRVITAPCPEFVTLVEAGECVGDQVESIVAKYVEPMLEQNVDTLVLGCTHYPFLKTAIQTVAGSHITLIDTGLAVARQTARLIAPTRSGSNNCSQQSVTSIQIYTTGDLKLLRQILPNLCPMASVDAAQQL